MTSLLRTLALIALIPLPPSCATPPTPIQAPEPNPSNTPNEAFKEVLQPFIPGPAIIQLQTLTGRWDVTLTLLAWPNQDVKVPATIATGTAHLRPTLGGRFVEWNTQLDWTGTPVSSRNCLGFNDTTERYEMWWSSTVSNAQRMARGRGTLYGSGITLERLERTGDEVLRLRTVLRATDVDHFELMELGFDPENASWMPRSVTRYARTTASTANRAAGEDGQ